MCSPASVPPEIAKAATAPCISQLFFDTANSFEPLTFEGSVEVSGSNPSVAVDRAFRGRSDATRPWMPSEGQRLQTFFPSLEGGTHLLSGTWESLFANRRR